MKIVVYAICKNEARFVHRWMDSMSEADQIVVLDTGSTDDSVAMLREQGATVVQEQIVPWRFDTARNRSLALVPEDTDLCVCTDLDEVLHPGWRAALEKVWHPGVKQIKYRYTWNFNPDGSEGYVFWIEKIHARQNFQWVNPVHEVLRYSGTEPHTVIYAEGVQLDHHADNSKSRGQYLPLLEMGVKENPENDRNVHYLGREYMFYQRWEDCIQTLLHHLSMPSATWPDERCASMRYIARAYENLKNPIEAEKWLFRAAGEAPHLREPWLDLARFYYRRSNWHAVLFFVLRALDIAERPRTYITEAESWGSLPYDLAALGYYYTGAPLQALPMAEAALSRSPQDTRLQQNLELIRKAIAKTKT